MRLLPLLLCLAACATSPHARQPSMPYAPPPPRPDLSGEQVYGGNAPAAVTMEVDEGTTTVGTLVAQAGGGTSTSMPVTPAPQTPSEKLVVSGSIGISVDDVDKAAADIHAETLRVGGKIINENTSGAPHATSGSLRLRLLPDTVEPFLDFLAKQGTVYSRQLVTDDVTKQYFDQELELKTLHEQLDRLQALGAKATTTQDELAVENEENRVRAQIEQLEGNQRYLADQVAYATLDVTLGRKEGAVFAPQAKFHPGPRFSVLTIFDPGANKGTRIGGGAVLHFDRAFSLDLDIFAKANGHVAAIATLGGAAYSDYLGGGHRRYGNPYIGFRAGYARLWDKNWFVSEAEGGVELVKTRYFLGDVYVRALALFTDGSVQGALEYGAEFAVPF